MATNGLLKYWDKIVYTIGLIFLAGVLYANVTNLKETKAEKSSVSILENDTKQLQVKAADLCDKKLDKTVFDSHEKRDDERFNMIHQDVIKRLERMEAYLMNGK